MRISRAASSTPVASAVDEPAGDGGIQPGLASGYRMDCGDAVGARHAHIYKDYIRAVGADLGKRILTIGGFGDDGDVFLGVDQHHDAGSHQRLIIDYHDSDHTGTFPRSPREAHGTVVATKPQRCGRLLIVVEEYPLGSVRERGRVAVSR
jgi:hypothetical protein